MSRGIDRSGLCHWPVRGGHKDNRDQSKDGMYDIKSVKRMYSTIQHHAINFVVFIVDEAFLSLSQWKESAVVRVPL